MLVREAIRLPHLSQNLCLAQQHGIKSCRNSKKVPHRLLIVVVIERHAKNIRTHRMKLAEKRRESRGAFMGRFRRHPIHFAAIAGGKHQRLFENPPGAQLLGRTLRLLGGKRHFLTHLHRRRAVI